MSEHAPAETPVQFVKGVGPARARLLDRLGVTTVEDLLYLFPRRYEDRRRLTPLGRVRPGELQTVGGRVLARGGRRSRFSRKHVLQAVVGDATGRIVCVWFNQPYIEKSLPVGRRVVLYGKVDVYDGRLQMVCPEFEILDEGPDARLHTGRIVPIYPLTAGIRQRFLRRVIRAALDRFLDRMEDPLPVSLRNRLRLYNIRHCLSEIHFPGTFEDQEEALRRVAFEEYFVFQLAVARRRRAVLARPGTAHRIEADLIRTFEEAFPFPLTGAQRRVIREIAADMQRPVPMLRLLQGDVGSGKTLAALFGCVAAWANGRQSAVMAPTEILARQHFAAVRRLFDEGPFAELRPALFLGGMSHREKTRVRDLLATGVVDVLVGTHALLHEDVAFRDLSFVVIDEQHKFGVRQRALLSAKGENPDVLVMTATPIPRTLSLTLYGDLDVSVIDEQPPGRGGVRTRVFASDRAEEAYRLLRRRVDEGRQAYVIYPLVETSETLDLKAAESMFGELRSRILPDRPVGLVHGRMNRREVEGVMERFQAGDLRVLVATTVVEVGVDVPNATVMVIEHAERFGLAQLHQLRGRINRGTEEGMCLLIADPSGEEARRRIEVFAGTTDGFRIAEEDFRMRGPGEYFGRHQHGLNELRFTAPAGQIELLERARCEAAEVLHADPELTDPSHRRLEAAIRRRYPSYLSAPAGG